VARPPAARTKVTQKTQKSQKQLLQAPVLSDLQSDSI